MAIGIITVTVSAAESENIYYTGSYNCDQNANAFITCDYTQIGVCAYQYASGQYIRAVTSTQAQISYTGMTATFTRPQKCNINGVFTGTYAANVIIANDVSITGGWLFQPKVIHIENDNVSGYGITETYQKNRDDHYYG